MNLKNKTPEDIQKIMKLTRKYKRNVNGYESVLDKIAIGKEVSLAKRIKYKPKKFETNNLEKLSKPIAIRYDTGELIVITKAKQLCGYVITITEKSPKKFRFSFVSKLHNYCIGLLEDLFKANVLNNKEEESKKERKKYQLEAFSKLKIIGYLSLLACENNCILVKQFEHISLLVSDCVNLLFSWRKSDKN